MEASCHAFKSHQCPSNYFDRYGSVKALVEPKNIAGSLKGARWQKECLGIVVEEVQVCKIHNAPHNGTRQERTKSSSWHGRGKGCAYPSGNNDQPCRVHWNQRSVVGRVFYSIMSLSFPEIAVEILH
jgi:hypothetical protein